jgi:transposase
MGISRNTVKKYLSVPEPVRQELGPRRRPVFEQVQPRLEELIEEWSDRTTPKQRLTATRLHQQLRSEGYQVGFSLVCSYVREMRRCAAEVYIPLAHRPGEEAQVDFFEVTVDINGERCKAWKFLMHLMYSGRDFAWIYERCDQLSFLEGHVRAFAHFGAVPERAIYDNLSAAVRKVTFPHRQLTDSFKALSNFYLLEPCFARPGEGHDKGGVESRGRGIRLQHLTPIPQGRSLNEVSERLVAELDEAAKMRKNEAGRTVEERFCEELGCMGPLPERPFDYRKVVPVRIRNNAMVRVEGAWYSVPESWARLEAKVFVGVETVEIVCRGERVERPKQPHNGKWIDYRDFLKELSHKPQAVRQVAPELMAQLGDPFPSFWSRLMETHGPREASRMMARTLGAVREHGEPAVRDAIRAMLETGRISFIFLAPRDEPWKRPEVKIPEAFASYEIGSVQASAYDRLLVGVDS